MQTSVNARGSKERPAGLTIIAVALIATAVYLAGCAILVVLGLNSLASGSMLLGGLETMGPTAFVIAAFATALTGYGLLRFWPWARRMAIVLLAAFLIAAIPSVSSAVADLRVVAIAREAFKIMAGVAVMRYLYIEAEPRVW